MEHVHRSEQQEQNKTWVLETLQGVHLKVVCVWGWFWEGGPGRCSVREAPFRCSLS